MEKGYELFIPGPLPGLNEMIDAAKGCGGTGRKYAAMKRSWTNTIALLAKVHLKPVTRARFEFTWHEESRRRNPDNVACGHKFVFDGLVQAGILKNDGWSEVLGWTDAFVVSDKPGVHVLVIEEPAF